MLLLLIGCLQTLRGGFQLPGHMYLPNNQHRRSSTACGI